MNSTEISNLLNSSLAIFVCLFADLAEKIGKIKLKNCITCPCDSVLLCFLCLSLTSLWTPFCKVRLTYRLYIHQLVAQSNVLLGYRYLGTQEHNLHLILLLRKPGQLRIFLWESWLQTGKKKSIKSFRRRKICKP